MISYDRLIQDADLDYYISFDNEKVGELQGEALVERAQGATRPRRRHRDDQRLAHRQQRRPFKKGAHTRSTRRASRSLSRVRHPRLEPDKAQDVMDRPDHPARQDRIVGVYAANDGTAGGAIAAMKGGRHRPAPAGHRPGRRARRHPAHPRRRPVHDRSTRRSSQQAEDAAELAVALRNGEKPTGDRRQRTGVARRCCSTRSS